jgi:PAS domain S-box-containing protein
MTREDFLRWASRFPEALLLVSTGGRIIACNGVLVEMLAIPEKTILQQSLFDWQPSSEEALRTALRLWSSSGRMVPAPFKLLIPSVGSLRCEGALLEPATGDTPALLVVRIKSQHEAIERFVRLSRTVDDLSKEVRVRISSEAEIRKQREWLHVTLSSIGDAVIATDVAGRVEFLNPVAEKLTGWTTAEAAGQAMGLVFDIFNEQTRELAENPVARVLREGVTIGLANHTVLRSRDGTERPIEDSAAPIRNGDGELIGVVLVFHDVSSQYEDRRAVERARDEALAASRAKDDFLAALSHELRTPLNPVLLIASESAANPDLPETVRRDFEIIAKNSLLEARLIDDLLDLTRITRGKMSLERRPVRVHAILREAIEVVGTDLEAKNLTLRVELGAERETVEGDAARLQQVFWNVLKNAVKFTPAQGEILISTRNGPEGEFLAEFTDTGRGMTQIELDRAFTAFVQGDHATKSGSHRFGGLGLGLAISQSLVKLHNGTIHARSEGRERGTTFTITLPTVSSVAFHEGSVAPRKQSVPNSRTPHGGLNLLLVEDHEPTRTSLARLLQRRGYKVVSCATAAAALDAARTTAFDLVVSDIGLPDGDGFELMKQLHQSHGLRGIAVTGYGMEQDVVNSHAAGFVAHLTKPVNVRTLDAALEAALADKQD